VILLVCDLVRVIVWVWDGELDDVDGMFVCDELADDGLLDGDDTE
jgi:hypothetical protein